MKEDLQKYLDMKEQKKFLSNKVRSDIVIIAGLEKANVADTICDLEINDPINATPIDPLPCQ